MHGAGMGPFASAIARLLEQLALGAQERVFTGGEHPREVIERRIGV